MLLSVFPSPVRTRSAVLVGVVMVMLGVLLGRPRRRRTPSCCRRSPPTRNCCAEAPSEIALQFTEAVDPIEPGIRLLDSDGDEVVFGAVDQSAGSDRMRASIADGLADGTYVVAWQGVSADSLRARACSPSPSARHWP